MNKPYQKPEILKELANLSDATVNRSVVEREDLNLYWKSEVFLQVISKPIVYKLLKAFTNNRETTCRVAVLASDVSQIFLNTGAPDKTLQQFRKQDCCRKQAWMGINWYRCGTLHSIFTYRPSGVVNFTLERTFLGMRYKIVSVKACV